MKFCVGPFLENRSDQFHSRDTPRLANRIKDVGRVARDVTAEFDLERAG